MVTGACLCGTVRYELDGPFSKMLNCHCSMCRKHHGAPFATFVSAPLSGLRWLSGRDAISTYASSPKGVRSFCSTCGSVTPLLMEAYGLAVVPAGNLQGDPGIRPQAHLFVGSKAPWYPITDDLPQYEEYPPELGMSGVERPPVAVKEGVIQGSCLCGDVVFELKGKPLGLWNCYCSRCRRGRSAAHAANVFTRIEQLEWRHGQDQVVEYRPPDARFFGVAFCRRCGGGVPRISSERNIAIAPAGSLDSDPGVRPSAHIYVGSKASWVDITDDVPQYEETPPSRP